MGAAVPCRPSVGQRACPTRATSHDQDGVAGDSLAADPHHDLRQRNTMEGSTMSNSVRTVFAMTLVAASLSPGVAGAMPFADALAIKNAAPAATETVQWRHGLGWGLGAGFVAGAILGGALAAPYYGPYYGEPVYVAPPPPVYYGGPVYGAAPGGDAVAYCMQRYRSYDPGSGTFLGYDGLRHPCP